MFRPVLSLSILLVAVVVFSCTTSNEKKPQEIVEEIIIPNSTTNVALTHSSDTIIEYVIDNVHSEGVGAEAKYVSGKIAEIDVHVCGGTGKTLVKYIFEKNKINVNEKKFTYPNGIENANSENGMKLQSEINYAIKL